MNNQLHYFDFYMQIFSINIYKEIFLSIIVPICTQNLCIEFTKYAHILFHHLQWEQNLIADIKICFQKAK